MTDFLMWLLIAGTMIFAGLRLWWIYRPGIGQVFWRTPQARRLYIWAGVILTMAVLLVFFSAQFWVLLLAIPAVYVVLACTAVKIDDRGIMANAMFARWQDINRLEHDEPNALVMVATRFAWRKIKLHVPPEKLGEFKKILAAKGLTLQPPVPGLAEESFA